MAFLTCHFLEDSFCLNSYLHQQIIRGLSIKYVPNLDQTVSPRAPSKESVSNLNKIKLSILILIEINILFSQVNMI